MNDTRIVTALTPHPLSRKIYGKEILDERLRDSIKDEGIVVPILITKDNVIVSGHRRWFHAKLLGVFHVPVMVGKFRDDLHVEKMVIESNEQREKTPEQRAREFKELKRIEAARAKERQAKAGKEHGRGQEKLEGNFPQAKREPQAADIAAEAVGMDRRTAERAAVVVDAIDAAEAQGDMPRAEELRETLNTKSVKAAHEKATNTPPPTPTPRPKRIPEPQPTIEESYKLSATEAKQLKSLQTMYADASEYVKAAFMQWAENF